MEGNRELSTPSLPPTANKSLIAVGTHLVIAGNPAGNSHHGEIHGEGTGQKGSTGDEHSGAQQHEPQHQPCYVGADKLVHCPGCKEKFRTQSKQSEYFFDKGKRNYEYGKNMVTTF